MARTRRVFGPLTYGTLAIALVVVLGLAITRIAPPWREFWEVRALARSLRSPYEAVRRGAADRLRAIGPAAAPVLIAALGDRREEVSVLACSRLAGLRAPERVVPVLVAELGEKRAAVRREAAIGLGFTEEIHGGSLRDEDRRAAVRGLGAALADEDPRVRFEAALGLERFGPAAGPAIPTLLAALGDRDCGVRYAAGRALLAIDPGRRDRAIAVLMELVTDPEPDFARRQAALCVVREAEPGVDARLIPALTTMLGRGDRRLRVEAILCLGEIGPPARGAIPALTAILTGEDGDLRASAADALIEIDRDDCGPAIAALVEAIADPALHLGRRGLAIRTVQEVRPGSEVAAVPALVEQLGSEDRNVRRGAIELLRQLGPPAKAAAPSLRRIAQDGDDPLAGRATDALREVAPEAAIRPNPRLDGDDPE